MSDSRCHLNERYSLLYKTNVKMTSRINLQPKLPDNGIPMGYELSVGTMILISINQVRGPYQGGYRARRRSCSLVEDS